MRNKSGKATSTIKIRTYSYMVEAWDRAGNKRNFVGEGFELPPYVVQDEQRLALLFAGKELRPAASRRRPSG